MAETNILSLKPSDTKKAVIACIKAGENVALVSAPGSGKTSIVGQASAELGYDLLVSLPAIEDSTEPGGLPDLSGQTAYADKKLFRTAYMATQAKKPTVWHLEDFGQAHDSVQKAYMQWALAREVDGKRLPDHVSITMATNRRIDKAGVLGILEPVKGRFTLIHMRSDLDDFCQNLFDRGKTEYKLSDDAITLGCAFLRFRTELLNAFTPTADMTNSPTERNWVSAFRHTDAQVPGHVEHALVAGRVGTGAATEFIAFLKIWRSMPSLDAILADPAHAPIPDRQALSALYAVSVGLAAKANPANFDRVRVYAERLEKARLGEFAVLMVRDSVRRENKIGSTRAWIEMTTGPVGKLMGGRE